MIAEDRAWWIKRLDREFKEKAERERNQMNSMPKPRMPHIPRR